jgi:hypothetical protein
LIVMAAALAVDSIRPIEYRSTAVLAVPPSLGKQETGDVAVASSLAASLRQIIPSDPEVRSTLARELDLDRSTVAERTSVSQPGDSTVLRLTYRSPSSAGALKGAEAFVRAVLRASRSTGEEAAGPADIPADSVRILEIPDTASLAAGRTLPYSATAAVVVQDAGSASVDADGARRLATTYAALITEDDEIHNAVRDAVSRAGQPAGDLELAATSEAETSVLDVTVSGPDRMAVLEGSRALADAVTDGDPVSDNIVPGSLAAVRVPKTPPAEQAGSSSAATLIAAAFVGILLGLVGLVGWERRQRRVAHGRDVSRLLDVPASVVSLADADAGRDLVRQWSAAGAPPPAAVALLPADGRARRSAEALAEALGRAGESPRASVLSLEANGSRAEPLSAEALTVLVARGGTPSDQLVDAFDDAVARGRRPGWAVLAD